MPSPWIEDRIAGLPCRVLLPERYEPQRRRYPLVVSLHGSGERGTDNVAQLRNGLDLFERLRASHPCIVVAPQLPRTETFGGIWYGGDTPGQRMAIALVRELLTRKSVDSKRLYGVGFSMGAIGLYDMLVRYRGLFTAAVLIAGELDLKATEPLVNFPMWSIVGGRDENVPPDSVRAFAQLVMARDGIAKVTEVAEAGHEVWQHAFAHAPVWDWLFSQVRS
ncbi:MAG: hypothetical protein ACJ790_23180 [Myxococcaceae bacterium]